MDRDGEVGMNFAEYQRLAHRTSKRNGLVIAALGLTGEAGEFADSVKKEVGHGHNIPLLEYAAELGDILWYIAECASELGLDLGFIAEYNIEKLKARYPNGFESSRSIDREGYRHHG